MDEINPGRLTLEQWISEVNFKFLENEEDYDSINVV